MRICRVVVLAVAVACSATAVASEPALYPPPPPPVLEPIPPPPPPLTPPPPLPLPLSPALPAPGTALTDGEEPPKRSADLPVRHGLAMKIGVAVPIDNPRDPDLKLHAGAGVRFGLLERPADGWGFNLAVALLAGGDVNLNLDEGAFNLELRVEGLYAGATQMLLPIARLYGLGGLRVVNGRAGTGVGGYFGAGLGFNMLPLIGKDVFSGGGWGGGGAGGGVALVLLFLLSPTAEVLYMRSPDGTWSPAYVLAFGL